MIETGVFMGVATIKRCSIEKTNALNGKLSSFRVPSKAQCPVYHQNPPRGDPKSQQLLSRRGNFLKNTPNPAGNEEQHMAEVGEGEMLV